MSLGQLDLGIRCGTLITMKDGRVEPRADQWVGVRGSHIVEVEPFQVQASRCKKFIDATDRVVMPGLINGHTHLPMTLLRGLADDLPFHKWLNDYIIPLEAKMVSPDFVRVGTELAAYESIRSGVTTVCDMYFYESDIAEAVEHSGLRALVAQAILDFPSPDERRMGAWKIPLGAEGSAWGAMDRFRERWQGHERITPVIGPHAPYTCSDEVLREAAEYSQRHGMPISIHVSETAFEVENSKKQFGMSPVQRMRKHGIMNGRAIFAHCVHLDDEDVRAMVETNTSAIYNPESNMKLSSGAAPLPRYLKAGMKLGIGTDGAASNNDLSVFREMDTGAKLQKLICRDSAAVTAAEMLKLATLGGAEALGIASVTGSIEIGKRADLIALDINEPGLQPVHDWASLLVYSTTGQETRTVICDGRVLMHEGKVETLSLSRIKGEVREWRDRIAAEKAG